MVFLKYEIKYQMYDGFTREDFEKEYLIDLNRKVDNYSHAAVVMFVNSIIGNKLICYVTCQIDAISKRQCRNIVIKRLKESDSLIEKLRTVSEIEISGKELEDALNEATHEGLINQDMFRVRNIYLDYMEGEGCKVKDKCIVGSFSYEQAINEAKRLMANDFLIEEIRRIYSSDNAKQFYGNVVHYLIRANNTKVSEAIYELLIKSLKANNRLLGDRVTLIKDISVDEPRLGYNFDRILYRARGCSVVVDTKGDDSEHKNYDEDYEDAIESFSQSIEEHGRLTLCFFIASTKGTDFSEGLMKGISANNNIIEINEGVGEVSEAKSLFKSLVEKKKVVVSDDDLNSYFRSGQVKYSVSDVYDLVERYCGKDYLKKYYKAYDKNNIRNEEYSLAAYKKLQNLVGLHELKTTVDQIITMGKMRNLRNEMGFKTEKQSMHMIFTGNPGSAKTTVARLLAEILSEARIIRRNVFVEVGRADLVGKYIGKTAPMVVEKFEEADGGILFIDEAYSLAGDSDRDYGIEAINTIVQEMENRRDNMIVIFAGYPDKMKKFLEKNEGLRSRISFHLKFPDYNEEEMCQILNYMTEKKGYILQDGVMDTCRDIFKDVCLHEESGNGRFVRNLLEHAERRQATRLLSGDINNIDRNSINLFLPSDFERPNELLVKEVGRQIGFTV